MPQAMKGYQFAIDSKLADYMQATQPENLRRGREKAVEAMGMVWADTAKAYTRSEKHIDTGLYINSIGYVTHFPNKKQATQNDVIHTITNSQNITHLDIGSNVDYAIHLEKRFSIFATALDMALPRMELVASTQISKVLFE